MKLDTFRRLDQHDRRIRQLERTETGGSGGATSLDDLTDVAAASMDDDDVLTFQASDNTWYPKAPTGLPGPAGPPGADGADSTVPGPPGEGVPAGGTAGQVLTKDTGTDFDTSWQTGAAHADSDHDDRFVQLPGAWTVMTPLTSPWVAGTNAPRYRLEGDVVRLDGIVSRPSGSVSTFFTLPSTFRPVAQHSYAVTATLAFGRVVVVANGNLNFTHGTGTGEVNLDGITFPIT